MGIGDYKTRARVLAPSGYGYEQSGGICFLSIEKPGKMSIFAHTAASSPQLTFEMWRRRDITPACVLQCEGAFHAVTDVTDLHDGKLTVQAVRLPFHKFSAKGAYIGEIEELFAFVAEKYMAAPEDEFHTDEQETNILLTGKAVCLSLGDLLTRDDGTVWNVVKRYTSGEYRNEYEVVRYGSAR